MKKGYYFINTNIDNGRAHTIQILKTVEVLNTKQGIEIVSPKYNSTYDNEEIFKFYGITKNIKINFLFNFGFSVMSKTQIIFNNFSAIIYLLSLKVRNKIKFIYFRSELFFPLLFIAKIIKVPYFFEIHRQEKNKRDYFIRNWLIKNAHGVVAINKELKENYKDLNQNILVSECGFDEKLFQFNEKKFNPNKFILGYAGGLEKHHGVTMIIRAMEFFKAGELHIVGGNEAQIKSLKKIASENVKFFGKIPYINVSEKLYDADILILPQLREDLGAVSSKMYEYFSLGKPILASNTPSNLLNMEEGKAVFYQKDDIDDFKDKLNMMINNFNYYKEKAKSNISFSKRYSFSARGKKINKFIVGSL